MTVAVTPVDVGSAEGDSTGDKARIAFQSVNTNEANFKAAIEELQGRNWTIRNTTLDPLVLGARYMANNHAGITFTLPATFAVSATAFSDVQVINSDDASDVTLTPASGDAFFVDGATHGVDTTYALTPGNKVILSPRTTDSEWDLIIVGSGGGGGWADMSEAVWAGGTQSEVADGASAVAFDYDTDATYSTTGAKLASWSNNGTEEYSMGFDFSEGFIVGPNATMDAVKIFSTGNFGTIRCGYRGTGSSNDYMVLQGTSNQGSCYFAGLLGSPGIHAKGDNLLVVGNTDPTGAATVVLSYNSASEFTNTLKADHNANRDRDGTTLAIEGGAGGATDRSGGDLSFDGGTATGSGTVGNIIMATLPTSDPTIAGALWNNSNVLNISTG